MGEQVGGVLAVVEGVRVRRSGVQEHHERPGVQFRHDFVADVPDHVVGDCQDDDDPAIEATLERACVVGGDTSGYVAPQLDIYALEYAAPVGPGSPLCEAAAHNPAFDGFETALKGGQVETTNDAADYFGVLRDGM